jgi:hypothetical protein
VVRAVLFEFIAGIVGNVLVTAGEHLLINLLSGDEVKRAVRATVREFPENHGIQGALTRWCSSEEFRDQFKAFQERQGSHTIQDEIDSFITIGLFYDSIHDTHRKGKAVIEIFKGHLEREIYRGSEGLLIESRRADGRYQEHQAGLSRIEKRLGRVPTIEDLHESFPGGDEIFITEYKESSIKYGHESISRNFHELKFITRPGRKTEIILRRAKPKYARNSLKISFVFGAEARLLLSNTLQDLKELIYQRDLSWLTYEGPGPWHRWTIYGEILLAAFPQLKYLTWLEGEFNTHPDLSSSPEPCDPAYSSSIYFNLLELDK